MTCETVREFFQHYFPMGLSMTFLALWYILMFRMAGSTCYLSMFTGTVAQLVVYRLVAAPADIVRDCLWITDTQWHMYRMADHAFLVFSM